MDRPQKALTLEARNLSRAVADKVLINNVSVQVQSGEVLAVIGRSGAGKSSFLRLLNGLDEPTGGTVLLDGGDYRAIAPRALRRRIGMVMQMAWLFPGTVADNIGFGPRHHGDGFDTDQIAALLDRVGLAGYDDREVTTLSGGEAQRVSVARTLANAPEALLLDEPTSSLDDTSARGIEDLLLDIIAEQRPLPITGRRRLAWLPARWCWTPATLSRWAQLRRCCVLTELSGALDGDLMGGLAQAGGAIALCAAVVVLCRRFAVHVEREAALSIGRGLVQMVFVGMVLALLLHSGLVVGGTILLLMTGAAAVTASRRSRAIGHSLLISFWAIGVGSGTVIAVMIASGALRTDIAMLVPVGSMIIANAMPACSQAAERFRADVIAHVGQIEAALALGADPGVTVAPYVRSAVYASLLPRLDMLKSLGLVWIPGMMAGMMVSGASPIYAGIYQFTIVAMILAASGLAGLVVTLLMRTQAFSLQAQLVLRP